MFVLQRSKLFIFLTSALIIFIYYLSERNLVTNLHNNPELLSRNVTLKILLKRLTKCNNKVVTFSWRFRGQFIVLNNLIRRSRYFSCEESITLTTHSTIDQLHNLLPLVELWQGPISIALYVPGNDYFAALDTIAFFRNCHNVSSLVRDLVSFHIFFDRVHLPKLRQDNNKIIEYSDTYNCAIPPSTLHTNFKFSYKFQHRLFYPINTARNIARENAETHFIFASDIELYPSPNFIEKFLKMVTRNPKYAALKQVFVLPHFEILANKQVPKNKTALQFMFKEKTAVWFHRRLCPECHQIYRGSDWIRAKENDEMDVFATCKRNKKQALWEPFYVGTNKDPYFDERFTWEGASNKMTQAYSMCLLDYNFMILDNAFLVHRPGIKKEKIQWKVYTDVCRESSNNLKTFIKADLIALYGFNPLCKVD